MLQFQYMAPWIPTFKSATEAELAANENDPPFITFQFATVDSQGFPHVRTLVYRGFLFDDRNSNVITCVTDKRTNKYKELLTNDKFEAVFYFPKIRKQFRFRGMARIIDNTYKPVIDLSSIQPKTIIQNNYQNSSDSDSDEDDDEEELEIKATNTSSSLNSGSENDSSCQVTSISHSLLSPSLLSQVQKQKSSENISYTNLQDLSSIDYYPPTEQEWETEHKRLWFNLSKPLKKSFRKPTPTTPINNENQKLIDSINRGVDGKKDEDGLKNFAVVGLFIDYVDLYELDKDRRYIYAKDSTQLWSEAEVCP